jgi:protein-tyrosine phosphatase
MQRSAAITAMYLIAKTGMTWQQAIQFIRNIRPIAFTPAANFKDSLIEFDRSYHQEIAPNLTS